jgi:thiol:disulfide interchange protein
VTRLPKPLLVLFLIATTAGWGCTRPVAASPRQDPIHWTLSVVSKGPVLPGREFQAGLLARIDSGWHLYALQEPADGPPPTVLALVAGGPFVMAGEIAAPPPKRAHDPNWNLETQYYEEQVSFVVPMRVAPRTALGRHSLQFTASFVTCNDTICLPPKDETVRLEINVGPDGPAAGVAAASTTGLPGSSGPPGSSSPGLSGSASAAPAGSVPGPGVSPSAAASAAPAVAAFDMAAASRASTLGAYIGLAALMGALSLLTPCVFPMVPITVSYFTNRARKSRREAGVQALIYGLGIVLTFTAVGFTLAIGFGASGLNRFAADPWLNLGVTAMFVAFAASLFGVWEIALPSKLVTAASKADSGKGRLAGTLLMGLAFTLTSFTCTAPFLGTLLVVASQGDWQWPLAGMLAFSGIFALPFVILAFVPQILASLPRSGPWLIAVKAVMGIIELAAAMKFLSNVDLVWGWNIFTRNVVLATWVVLAVILVAYLAGLVKLGPVPKLPRPGVGRWALTAAAVALAVWLTSGLGGRRLGELEAFLPPADLASMSGELEWSENKYDEALAHARQTGQPLFIDFTGYTCTNCRWMEANMFTRPDVMRELARYTRARLYTDRPGEPYRGYQTMQQDLFKTVALPLYAVMTPEGKPVVFFSGLTRDPAEFIAFLRRGLQ